MNTAFFSGVHSPLFAPPPPEDFLAFLAGLGVLGGVLLVFKGDTGLTSGLKSSVSDELGAEEDMADEDRFIPVGYQ
jgi:hypothetical protein